VLYLHSGNAPVAATRLSTRARVSYVFPLFDIGRWNEIDRDRFFLVSFVMQLPDPAAANGLFWGP
jgi:hypothetical protein